MLDILEIAKEKGIQEGKLLGILEGKALGILEGRREMLRDDLIERFGLVPARIIERIWALSSPDVLKVLHRQIPKCQNITEFEAVMEQVL